SNLVTVPFGCRAVVAPWVPVCSAGRGIVRRLRQAERPGVHCREDLALKNGDIMRTAQHSFDGAKPRRGFAALWSQLLVRFVAGGIALLTGLLAACGTRDSTSRGHSERLASSEFLVKVVTESRADVAQARVQVQRVVDGVPRGRVELVTDGRGIARIPAV